MKYFFIFLLIIPLFINSQTINIKGSINSSSGVLSYATVKVVDSDLWVISDEKGKFNLKIDLNTHNTLLISFLGYISKKISLKN